jgi:tRNA U55 pseudouridine synthase TruB
MSDEERLSLLIPIERLFDDLPAVKLPAFYEKLCRNGCEIYQKKINTDHEIGTRVRLCDASGAFFALGEVRDYENGTAIKGIK